MPSMNIYLSKDLYKRLYEKANGENPSKVIQKALKEYFEKKRGKK